MKKIFLRAVVLLLVLSLSISAFASCGETEKQDNAQSEKEEVNDSEKTSGDEGASDEGASDDKGAPDEDASDDNEIGTEGLAYKLLDDDTYEVSVGTAKEAIEIVIPSKYNGKPVTSIGYEAFKNCTGLTSVTIGNGVESIGPSAFRDCTGLTSIEIPDSVTSIGYSAFRDCTGLTSIDIPDSVKSIDSYVFENCTNLMSVTIGNGVESIDSSAFSETAYYNNESSWENGVLYIGKYLIDAKYDISGDYSVKEGTKIIASEAFDDRDGLTSIDIPDSVKSIGDFAFQKCNGLTSIKFRGSEAEWNAIEKGEYWNYYVHSSCQIIFNYTGE